MTNDCAKLARDRLDYAMHYAPRESIMEYYLQAIFYMLQALHAQLEGESCGACTCGMKTSGSCERPAD